MLVFPNKDAIASAQVAEDVPPEFIHTYPKVS